MCVFMNVKESDRGDKARSLDEGLGGAEDDL